MTKQDHWFNPYRASEFCSDLLEAAIEVTKTTPNPAPPKPKPAPDKIQK